MARSWLVAAALASACGRVHFDPIARDAAATVDAADAAQAFCASDPALVACYEFEGTAADATPNHNDPSTAIGVAFGPGESGQGLAAGATMDLRMPVAPPLDGGTAVTIETWLRVDTDPGALGQTRSMALDHNNQIGAVIMPGPAVVCTVSTNSNPSVSVPAAPIALGVWIHVACRYDGAQVETWISGALIGGVALTGPLTPTADGIRVAGNWPDPTNTLDDRLIGAIDQLRIWSSVRTAQQICQAAGTC
jgi:hypothetical protein